MIPIRVRAPLTNFHPAAHTSPGRAMRPPISLPLRKISACLGRLTPSVPHGLHPRLPARRFGRYAWGPGCIRQCGPVSARLAIEGKADNLAMTVGQLGQRRADPGPRGGILAGPPYTPLRAAKLFGWPVHGGVRFIPGSRYGRSRRGGPLPETWHGGSLSPRPPGRSPLDLLSALPGVPANTESAPARSGWFCPRREWQFARKPD